MSTIGLLLAMALFGYLLGSIPFGLVLTRAAGLGDVRKIGSGNIGATNVLRTGNKGLAVATLLLDALKGTAAVVIGWWVAPRLAGYGGAGTLPTIAYSIPVAAGLGAVIGHLYPVWLGFKGGKGVATFIGVLLGLAWPLALIFCAIWLLVAGIARYSSLASLVATLAVTFLAALGGDRIGMPRELVLAMKPAVAVMALLLIVRHHGNIKRLLAGEEPRIGQKRDSSGSPGQA